MRRLTFCAAEVPAIQQAAEGRALYFAHAGAADWSLPGWSCPDGVLVPSVSVLEWESFI